MASYDHDAAEEAISSIESGGKYDTLGPKTANGDQAYGKYQVMGANIPEWTKAATGTAMTPAQFLADEDAQDTTFHHRFGSYVDKYGTPEDAASAWFTGGPRNASTGARSDVLGTTGNSYVSKFADKYYDELGIPNPNSNTKAPKVATADDEEEAPALTAANAGALSGGGAKSNWLSTLGQTMMNVAPGLASISSPAQATALAAAAAANQKVGAGSWTTQYNPITGIATQTNSADPSQMRQFKYAPPKPDEKWGVLRYGPDGKPVEGYIPSKAEYDAQNTPEAKAAAAAKEAASNADASLTGQEYMDSLTKAKGQGYSARVQAIVDGREALPTGRAAMEGTPGGQLVKDVMQVDPAYEQGNPLARVKLRQQFETASAPNSPAVQIKNGNTTLSHGGTLSDAIEKFKSFNDHAGTPYISYGLNAAHNSSLGGTSSEEAQAYAAAIDAREHYGDEISKYYGGGPAGEHAKQRALANIDFNKSLPELRSVLATDAEMVHGKTQTYQDQWRAGMNGSSHVKDFPVVSEEGQAAKDRILSRFNATKDGSYTGSGTKATPGIPKKDRPPLNEIFK